MRFIVAAVESTNRGPAKVDHGLASPRNCQAGNIGPNLEGLGAPAAMAVSRGFGEAKKEIVGRAKIQRNRRAHRADLERFTTGSCRWVGW